MRKAFAEALYKEMEKNEDIWLLVGDLGYGVFDKHFQDFPHRTLNTGAAEQAMLDISCGLAIEGKTPFVYSITTFILYRPFETIRTYINHEKLNIKLVGSGRGTDYSHDGISHWSTDAKPILDTLSNIRQHWPNEADEVYPADDMKLIVKNIIKHKGPEFISLRR